MISMICPKVGPIRGKQRTAPEISGFTLVEMLIVIAVILILSAVAIPAYISWLPRYRLNSAADDLLSVLQQAKLRAIKENANVVVDFDPDNNGEPDGRFIVFVDNGLVGPDTFNPVNRNNNILDGEEKTILNGRLANSVTVDEVEFNGNQTYTHFTNRGLGFNGHIHLSNRRGDFMGVVTTMTGNIRKTDSK